MKRPDSFRLLFLAILATGCAGRQSAALPEQEPIPTATIPAPATILPEAAPVIIVTEITDEGHDFMPCRPGERGILMPALFYEPRNQWDEAGEWISAMLNGQILLVNAESGAVVVSDLQAQLTANEVEGKALLLNRDFSAAFVSPADDNGALAIHSATEAEFVLRRPVGTRRISNLSWDEISNLLYFQGVSYSLRSLNLGTGEEKLLTTKVFDYSTVQGQSVIIGRKSLTEVTAGGNLHPLYILDTGSAAERLLDLGDCVDTPALSHDGSHAVFTAYRDNWPKTFVQTVDPDFVMNDYQDIYLLELDGWQLTNLTNSEAPEATPTWSPDDSRVAFYAPADEAAEELNLCVMTVSMLAQQCVFIGTDTYVSGPAWSPAGDQIAFMMHGGDSYQLLIVAVDPMEIQQRIPLPPSD